MSNTVSSLFEVWQRIWRGFTNQLVVCLFFPIWNLSSCCMEGFHVFKWNRQQIKGVCNWHQSLHLLSSLYLFMSISIFRRQVSWHNCSQKMLIKIASFSSRLRIINNTETLYLELYINLPVLCHSANCITIIEISIHISVHRNSVSLIHEIQEVLKVIVKAEMSLSTTLCFFCNNYIETGCVKESTLAYLWKRFCVW